MLELPSLDLPLLGRVLAHLGIAFVVALPGAWEREHSRRNMGLRTLPLVAITACAMMLVARLELGNDEAIARVVQGLITGIGFLGGGAIVKSGLSVEGSATAATIWLTSALGIAVGLGRIDVALTLAVINVLVLRLLSRNGGDAGAEESRREPAGDS